MINQRLIALVVATVAILQTTPASAFISSSSLTRAARPRSIHRQPTSSLPPVPSSRTIATQLPPLDSITTTILQSFFGLGPAELAVVAVAGLVLVGPSKLVQFSKEAGAAAGKTGAGIGDEWSDLKSIPEEFQKGVQEGEIEARSRKAKDMEVVKVVVEEEK